MQEIFEDVTEQVYFGNNDGEAMPLLKCICGKEYEYWDFIIGIYPDTPAKCECGREFYFNNKITVYVKTPNKTFNLTKTQGQE